jgi:hypothetical protein
MRAAFYVLCFFLGGIACSPTVWKSSWVSPTHRSCPPSSPTVAGGGVRPPTVGNAALVVTGMRAGFRDCYQEELHRDLAAQGTVRLTLSINCEGLVTSVHAATEDLSSALVSCLSAVAGSGQFAAPDGGSAVIQMPVTFVLGEEPRKAPVP